MPPEVRMSETVESAREAVARADALVEKVEGGSFVSEKKEAAAVDEARGLYLGAIEVLEGAGDVAALAGALHGLGHLVRRVGSVDVQPDPTAAEPLLLRAADLWGSIGDVSARLRALVGLGESRPMHPTVEEGVMEAVAAGLPPDLHPDGDPLHLIVARSQAQQPDAAVALAEALFAEAMRAGNRPRAARVLIEIGRVEDGRKRRKEARERFEAALELAEGDNEQTLRALLHLVDAWWSTGNAKKAKELFARAEKIRGVPESLRTLRKMTAMALR
ncbi:MAG: hypothetical protein R3F61_20450 [Myxococcota bacterium]